MVHATKNAMRRYGVMYALLLPGLLYFVIFKYVPMVYIAAAFKDYNVLRGLWESPWIGWQNFETFFNGVYAGQIIGNTLLISAYKLIFSFPAPIILALMLNAVTSNGFKRTIQTLTYLPHFLSWVVIYGLLVAFLAPGSGLVNQLFNTFGLERISFLTESGMIRSLIVTTDIWQSVGWGAIIYLASLAGIDPSLYEAAKVDGASRWRQLWHITLPGIRNVIILLLVLRLSAILDVGFDQIFIMLNPLNQENADVIETWVYRVGMQEGRIGLATAVGLFKSIIGFVLVLGANKMAKKFDGQIW
ncbi:ABC transporter permease [Paenibacillus herberti]|uniref:Polysaccharide ABC transporter ATP-binding protein n=1 Tax=Paenibacillus herberti TaxID=1619309 RepID=A0A229P213_9BACL|nr:ABC transporter permease subunit [Paenibacillus herberti]OXM16326.1 polysaccharide ABC transporter ATP-binding protein [Paenibacillus herberti]